MNKIGMRADKTAVDIRAEDNVLCEPVSFDQLPNKDYHWIRVMELTEHSVVIPKEDENKYIKDTFQYHMGCPECENGIGRYDDLGEIICQECGLVISHRPDEDKSFAGTIYGDKYCQGTANEANNRNRGASGGKFQRPPALRDPGPSNEADFGSD